MSYPFFEPNYFITEKKIDVNFQDESGNTSINTLINNKEYIIAIGNNEANVEVYDFSDETPVIYLKMEIHFLVVNIIHLNIRIYLN